MVLVAKIAGRFWQAWAALLAAAGNRAGLERAWPGLGHNRIVIVIIVYEKSHSFLVLRWDAAMAGNPHRTNELEFVQNSGLAGLGQAWPGLDGLGQAWAITGSSS